MAMADRRQIERDLHDGAQQRLLALGMELSMALEKFDTDPEAARALVGDAHQELQRAIAELRDLARGIHPAVLTDRASTPRCPRSPRAHRSRCISTCSCANARPRPLRRPRTSSSPRRWRTPPSTRTPRCRRPCPLCRRHAACRRRGRRRRRRAEHPGGGLAGLADRASSVEGSLQISSPQGGPTILTAELPCAS